MEIRTAILLLLVEAMSCLVVTRVSKNLVRIPDDIDPAVTELNLSYNNIEGIDVTSLAAFGYLSILSLQYNSIRHIEEGAFDNNRFLTLLRLSYNSIEIIPSSFGAAKNSLATIQLWDSLTAKAIPQANFSECIKLEFLNIGSNPYYILNVSILPHNPTNLAFHNMELVEFPDLRYQTPYLEILHIQNNRITAIPSERIQGLKYLKTIYIAGNRIKILPDVTGTDITAISLVGNPWICNSLLCEWRIPPNMAIRGDAPTCNTPAVYRGQLVMDVDRSIFACGSSKWWFRGRKSTMLLSQPVGLLRIEL